MHRRIILAALAATLAVPAVASATDKATPEAWQNKAQTGGSTSQAVGGQGSNNAAVGQIGNAATVGQMVGGSTPAGVGQAGGDGSTPVESAYACGPAKDKTPKSDPISSKFSKGDPADDPKSSKLPLDEPKSSKPGDDTAAVEDRLREQREMVDRLTELLNEMHQRQNDVTRSITGG